MSARSIYFDARYPAACTFQQATYIGVRVTTFYKADGSTVFFCADLTFHADSILNEDV